MQLTKFFCLRRKSSFRIEGHKYAKHFNSNWAIFRYGLGYFVYLNFASLFNVEVCQKI